VGLAVRVPPTLVEKGSNMKALGHRVRNFLVSEDGPTATEYAVMLALIIVVAIAAISTLGGHVNDTFTDVDNTAFGS
jgi:pilus assembly protein Flp/PilA